MKTRFIRTLPPVCLVAAALLAVGVTDAMAYPRYKNNSGTSGSYCSQCHGNFDGSMSPQGTVFPSNDKHHMHRSADHMDTECNLCHTTGDGDNPYIGTSNGTANNAGLGCVGCHLGPGLRAHHVVNGVNCTSTCHSDDPVPDPESTNPPYYGSVDTKADNPCNDSLVADANENWSVGDLVGLDNDGDNLYDQADFDCGPPYRVLSAVPEGDNIRITWETVGGRTDAIQASAEIAAGYSDVTASIPIPGVGPVVTNALEVGGAGTDVRFYRVRSAP